MVTIPLAFYTSRVVLQQLGVDDFGIYQAVAGLISLFAILRGAFDSATQRYYNVALAKADNKLLSQMFSASVTIHLCIAALLVIAIGFFGNWFIENKMQYPADAVGEVYFVFYTMVISVVFLVMNIPFSGMIIAQEHMKFYAYVSISDVAIKLGLVLILIFVEDNKLRVYALFQMSVPIIICAISAIYFKINFREVQLIKFNKQLVKEMSCFSGWGLIGTLCYSLVHEGVNLLLNVYGGVVANAARGIAFQVRGIIANVLMASIMPVKPQATQLYVSGEQKEFWPLIYTYSKILFFLASVMILPIIFYSKDVLLLWLGMVPDYSVIFLQILMAYTLIRSLHEPIDIVFKASGRMRTYQLTTVGISSLTFILGWIALSIGLPVYSPFIIFCFVEASLLLALLYKAKYEGLSLQQYLCAVLKPCFNYLMVSLSICFVVKLLLNIWWLGIGIMLSTLCSLIWLIGLKRTERTFIKSKLLHITPK